MITWERLTYLLAYDPLTGVFRWRQRTSNRVKVGEVAGREHGNGYLRVSLDKSSYFLHRLAWFYVHARWPDKEIDHIDGVRRNNAIRNLRPAEHRENGQNQPFLRSTNTSGYCGVSWSKPHGKWAAYIYRGGRKYHLGLFGCEKEAARAHLAAKREMHWFQPSHRDSPQI